MKPHGLLSENKYDQLHLYSSKQTTKISTQHTFTLNSILKISIIYCFMERIHLRGIDNTLLYFSKVQAVGIQASESLKCEKRPFNSPSYFIYNTVET